MEVYYLINHTHKTIVHLYEKDEQMLLKENPKWEPNNDYEVFIKGYNYYYINYLLLEEAYISGYANHFLKSDSEWKHYNKMIKKRLLRK